MMGRQTREAGSKGQQDCDLDQETSGFLEECPGIPGPWLLFILGGADLENSVSQFIHILAAMFSYRQNGLVCHLIPTCSHIFFCRADISQKSHVFQIRVPGTMKGTNKVASS